MAESQQTGTKKADHSSQPARSGPRSLSDHARRLRRDTSTLASDATTLASDVGTFASEVRESAATVFERTVADQLRTQPVRTLGLAAGVGYLLGGGVPLRLTGLLFGTVTRVAASLALLREIAELGQQLQSSFAGANATENRPRP